MPQLINKSLNFANLTFIKVIYYKFRDSRLSFIYWCLEVALWKSFYINAFNWPKYGLYKRDYWIDLIIKIQRGNRGIASWIYNIVTLIWCGNYALDVPARGTYLWADSPALSTRSRSRRRWLRRDSERWPFGSQVKILWRRPILFWKGCFGRCGWLARKAIAQRVRTAIAVLNERAIEFIEMLEEVKASPRINAAVL